MILLTTAQQLHHMNVDRLFAMWQTINPNSYGATQVAPHDTWTIASGTTLNADSPLTPFHKDTVGTFWTSNMVRNWATTFKYTYPEFTNSDGSKNSIVSYVAKLYGPSATATAGSSKRTPAPEPGLLKSATAAFPLVSAGLAPLTNLTGHPFKTSNGSLYEYVANIKTPRWALNGSYDIYLFNGAPASEDPSTWLSDRSLIGPMGVLAGGMAMKNSNLMVAGSVPLTRTLQSMVTDSDLPDMSEDHCIPYLTEHLTWRVAKSGESVDASTIPGFEVSVYSSTSSPLTLDSLPQWSNFIPQVQITKEKAGGAKVANWGSSSSSAPAPTAYAGKSTVTKTVQSTTTLCSCSSITATSS